MTDFYLKKEVNNIIQEIVKLFKKLDYEENLFSGSDLYNQVLDELDEETYSFFINLLDASKLRFNNDFIEKLYMTCFYLIPHLVNDNLFLEPIYKAFQEKSYQVYLKTGGQDDFGKENFPIPLFHIHPKYFTVWSNEFLKIY